MMQHVMNKRDVVIQLVDSESKQKVAAWTSHSIYHFQNSLPIRQS
jgi:hypothetical protein